MTFRSNLVVLFLLLLALAVPGKAMNLPLFPNMGPVLCSVVDAPWYVCDSSRRIDGNNIPRAYDGITDVVGFISNLAGAGGGGGGGGGGIAAGRAAPSSEAEDNGGQRRLRRSSSQTPP